MRPYRRLTAAAFSEAVLAFAYAANNQKDHAIAAYLICATRLVRFAPDITIWRKAPAPIQDTFKDRLMPIGMNSVANQTELLFEIAGSRLS